MLITKLDVDISAGWFAMLFGPWEKGGFGNINRSKRATISCLLHSLFADCRAWRAGCEYSLTA